MGNKKKNNIFICKLGFALLLALSIVSCKNEYISPIDNEILYGVDDSFINKLIIDSVLRDDFPEVTYCIMDYYLDTIIISFFYKDDDYSPWTNEMVARTNRFLKVDTYQIPIIFEPDISFVIEDSVMSEPSIGKQYNLFNYADLKLHRDKEFIEFRNRYEMFGRVTSEEGRKKYKK